MTVTTLPIIKNPGAAPFVASDDTRAWVEAFGRENHQLKPSLVLRHATDTNYLRDTYRHLYGADPYATQRTKAIINLSTPCQRVPGVLNWSVNETDQVTQTASVDILNCLPVSTVETTLSSTLELGAHSATVQSSYVADSLGVVQKVNTSGSVELQTDPQGYRYREEKVKYRTFTPQQAVLTDASLFPQPAIPLNDADNDVVLSGSTSSTGVGAYFILLGGEEIIRVTYKASNTLTIGTRNVGVASEKVKSWPAGTRVQLLGFGPYTGEWAGMGYLSVDDFKPQTAILRPGTCLTSYEGWGNINAPLSHNGGANYAFTGYWFVSGVEPSMGEDGVPRIRVDLKSAGYMYEKQKITPDLLRRAKTQFGQWGVRGRTLWGVAGANRNIPGDWVDYNSWDPSLPTSYPLRIKTELAQHKEFFNHMVETNSGATCPTCKLEQIEWLKTHAGGGANVDLENRAVGRHIYQTSIRVLRAPAGPIKTYIRLMATLAAAAWDHPAYGTELSQAFTKIPNDLFTNIRATNRGLLFNGQIDLELDQTDQQYDWFSPTYTDAQIRSRRNALTCPFEATYDKAPFSQPMIDLAEANGNKFWVSRKGEPVFVPRGFNYRPYGQGGQWFQSYGGSISQYSNSLNADDVVTQCWVTATSAFESKITVLGAGTGIDNTGDGKGPVRLAYSPLGGNKNGLALTAGVQQIETLTLDNVLGLDWDTNASGWGVVEEFPDGTTRQLNAFPPLWDGSPTLFKGGKEAQSHPDAVRMVQQTIRFFIQRRYITPVDASGQVMRDILASGKFGDETDRALKSLQTLVGVTADGIYGRTTHNAIRTYINTNKHYIQFDIWWYVKYAPRDGWEQYLSAITGVAVKLGSQAMNDGTDAVYAIDDKGTQSQVGEWTKTFARQCVNAGNRVVDDSLNKAMVRSLASNMADPRIQPGDIIWAQVPGFLELSQRSPHTNGIFVTSIARNMDLSQGSYTATYTGYRFVGDYQQGLPAADVAAGYSTVN